MPLVQEILWCDSLMAMDRLSFSLLLLSCFSSSMEARGLGLCSRCFFFFVALGRGAPDFIVVD